MQTIFTWTDNPLKNLRSIKYTFLLDIKKSIKVQMNKRRHFMKSYICMKESAEDDVIDGDEEELDNVSDASHDGESQSARLCDFLEFYIYRQSYLQRRVSRRPTKICMTRRRTFLLIELCFRFLCSLYFLINLILNKITWKLTSLYKTNSPYFNYFVSSNLSFNIFTAIFDAFIEILAHFVPYSY